MNLPNQLTVSRIILSPVFMVLLLNESFWSRLAALFVFIIASLTDMYDGYLARKTGIITNFGKFMDPLADKLLVSMALISFIALRVDYIVPWMVVVIVARDFLITGLRTVAAYRGLVIPASGAAKWKTVLQMLLIIVTQVHILLQMAHVKFGTPLLLIGEDAFQKVILGILIVTTLQTLATGLSYLLSNRAFIKQVLS